MTETGTLPERFRKRLFDALLGDVSMLDADDPARTTLENAAARDVAAIEPIIQEMLASIHRGTLPAPTEGFHV